jgi:hypothetical protein
MGADQKVNSWLVEEMPVEWGIAVSAAITSDVSDFYRRPGL